MKMNKWLPFSSIAFIAALLAFCSSKRLGLGEPLVLLVYNTLSDNHYSPAKLNDSFSLKVYRNTLDKLDNDKRFFTQKDINKLKKYATSIDDQIKAGRTDFFDEAWKILMNNLNVLEKNYNTQLGKTWDYKTDESITIEETPEHYAKDENSLKEEWRKWLKYQCLDKVYRKLEAQKNKESLPDSVKATTKILPYDTIEKKSRTETKLFCDNWFKRWRKLDRKDQLRFYINCISEVYDPHTEYFPPEDKANFDIGMTGKLEGIGATLSEREGQIKVERIVPGSASYRQGELKAGDIIIKVAQGHADPVDVVEMKLDDAIKLVRGKKGTEVRLTVKRPDGSIKVIPIIRDVVIIEESFARSAVVEDQGKKYGIINLPSFYADFSAKGRGRHSAEDVYLEIEKLKKEGVSGIVLDLRNNGGGSLSDAVDMGGLFIKKGPIVQVRSGNGVVNAYQDKNAEIAYDGPFVIMTNTFSASASEILAAAMQDYSRAVIIGTKSTFGKGTVQTFIPLQGRDDKNFKDGYGQMKVTIQKFYRINGGTTQLRGVIPDIIIPDMYDSVQLGEKEFTYRMEYDNIDPAGYDQFNGGGMSKKAIAVANAQKRIAASDYFKNIQHRSIEIGKNRKKVTYSLNLDKYTAEMQAKKEDDAKYNNDKYTSVVGTISALKSDLDEVKGDAVREAQRKEWLKAYGKDATFDQAILTLKDLVE